MQNILGKYYLAAVQASTQNAMPVTLSGPLCAVLTKLMMTDSRVALRECLLVEMIDNVLALQFQ